MYKKIEFNFHTIFTNIRCSHHVKSHGNCYPCKSMMVDDHCVNHIIHFLMLIEPWHIGDVVLGLINLDESLINEFNMVTLGYAYQV